ncbi:hypothetical protein Hanom_Chr06g00480681 [Helianthus anomalus]
MVKLFFDFLDRLFKMFFLYPESIGFINGFHRCIFIFSKTPMIVITRGERPEAPPELSSEGGGGGEGVVTPLWTIYAANLLRTILIVHIRHHGVGLSTDPIIHKLRIYKSTNNCITCKP